MNTEYSAHLTRGYRDDPIGASCCRDANTRWGLLTAQLTLDASDCRYTWDSGTLCINSQTTTKPQARVTYSPVLTHDDRCASTIVIQKIGLGEMNVLCRNAGTLYLGCMPEIYPCGYTHDAYTLIRPFDKYPIPRHLRTSDEYIYEPHGEPETYTQVNRWYSRVARIFARRWASELGLTLADEYSVM